MSSRFIGVGPNHSGLQVAFSGSGFASDNLTGFGKSSAAASARMNWRFLLPFDAQWSLTLDAVMADEPGTSAYLARGASYVDPASAPLPIVFVTDTVQGWLAPPVEEGAILVPEPPVLLTAVALPPADLSRGAPYRLSAYGAKGEADLGVFESGSHVDLVALTGGGLSGIVVTPTSVPDPAAPRSLALRVETSDAPATIRAGEHPSQIERLFTSSFESATP